MTGPTAFPRIREALASLRAESITIDGEAVVLCPKTGISLFDELPRVAVTAPCARHSDRGGHVMPVTLLYGPERARVAHLVLSLFRTVRNAYMPELTLAETSEFVFLLMHLFIGHAAGRPLSASRLAHIAEMPRTTVLRRLDILIKLGYVQRDGNSYCLTTKANVPNQRGVLLKHINNIQHAAKELSKMDIPPLTKAH